MVISRSITNWIFLEYARDVGRKVKKENKWYESQLCIFFWIIYDNEYQYRDTGQSVSTALLCFWVLMVVFLESK